MSNEELDQLVKEIIANLELGADLVGIADPEIIPAIIVGKAIDKMVPGLAKLVNSWVQGNLPTPEETANLRGMLSVLGDPNLP